MDFLYHLSHLIGIPMWFSGCPWATLMLRISAEPVPIASSYCSVFPGTSESTVHSVSRTQEKNLIGTQMNGRSGKKRRTTSTAVWDQNHHDSTSMYVKQGRHKSSEEGRRNAQKCWSWIVMDCVGRRVGFVVARVMSRVLLPCLVAQSLFHFRHHLMNSLEESTHCHGTNSLTPDTDHRKIFKKLPLLSMLMEALSLLALILIPCFVPALCFSPGSSEAETCVGTKARHVRWPWNSRC